MVELKFKKLLQDAVVPTKNNGNIGIDLSAVADKLFCPKYTYETIAPDEWGMGRKNVLDKHFTLCCEIPPKSTRLLSTGLACDIPDGYALILKDRSGLASKHGIHVFAGVIDSSYTGEIKVCLYNSKNEPYRIWNKDRICQAILVQDFIVNITEVNSLKTTERGEKGFGSSGK